MLACDNTDAKPWWLAESVFWLSTLLCCGACFRMMFENISYEVPKYEYVKRLYSQPCEARFCHMRRKPPWGVTFMTNKDLALEVKRVSKNSEAERAGMTRGLVLTSVNGARAVRAPDGLRLLKDTKPPLTLGFNELCGCGTPSPTATLK